MGTKRWIVNEMRTSEYVIEAPDTMSQEQIESWANDHDSHELFLFEDLFEGIDEVTLKQDTLAAEDAFIDVQIDGSGQIIGGDKI